MAVVYKISISTLRILVFLSYNYYSDLRPIEHNTTTDAYADVISRVSTSLSGSMLTSLAALTVLFDRARLFTTRRLPFCGHAPSTRRSDHAHNGLCFRLTWLSCC